MFMTPTTVSTDVENIYDVEEASKVTANSNQFSGDLGALDAEDAKDARDAKDAKVKSMIGRSKKIIQKGKRASGKPKQTKAFICKVCGKEGHRTDIRNHIEGNHLEGMSIPCDYCFQTFCSRDSLRKHKSDICKATT